MEHSTMATLDGRPHPRHRRRPKRRLGKRPYTLNSPFMPTERTWRDEALDQSLAGFNYENHLEAMMAAIRRARPSWPTNIVPADRARSLDFLAEHGSDVHSLLCAPHAYTGDDEDDNDAVWADWIEVAWQGSTFELVYLGGEYNSRIIALAPGEDAEKLSQFTRALQDYAARPANPQPNFQRRLGRRAPPRRRVGASDVGRHHTPR